MYKHQPDYMCYFLYFVSENYLSVIYNGLWVYTKPGDMNKKKWIKKKVYYCILKPDVPGILTPVKHGMFLCILG